MHSGTTLLQKILEKAPEIRSIDGETKFFDFLSSYSNQAKGLPNTQQGVRELVGDMFRYSNEENLSDLQNEFQPEDGLNPVRLFKSVGDKLAEMDGARLVLEKSPNNVFHIQSIQKCFPGSKILCLIRDPRAVLASKKNRVAKVDQGVYADDQIESKKLEKDYNPVLDALSWRSSIRAIFEAKKLFRESLVIVKYEDLVAKPEEVCRSIFERIGIPFHRSYLEIDFFSQAMGGELKPRGIYKTSLNDWRQSLSRQELLVAETLTGSEMKNLGYPRQTQEAKLQAALYSIPHYLKTVERMVKRLKFLGPRGFLIYIKNIVNR